jgi:hypothetical protein
VGGCDLYPNPWDPPEASGETEGDPDKTFFMAEVTAYSTATNSCQDYDVATVTADFKNTLQLEQWSGQRRSSFETRPSDFYDQGFTAYGKDHLHADSKRVSVFAGHGHIGIHGFRLTDPENPNVCTGETGAYMGGQGQGDQQSLFINVASCGGAFDEDPQSEKFPFGCFAQNWNLSQFRQWLGFADSPVVDPTGLSTFYNSLPPNYDSFSGQLDVWIDVMEFPESGVATMPVVYTKQTLSESQQYFGETIHHQMNMRSGKYMDDNSPNKQYLLMTPQIPIDGFTNFCAGGLFSC